MYIKNLLQGIYSRTVHLSFFVHLSLLPYSTYFLIDQLLFSNGRPWASMLLELSCRGQQISTTNGLSPPPPEPNPGRAQPSLPCPLGGCSPWLWAHTGARDLEAPCPCWKCDGAGTQERARGCRERLASPAYTSRRPGGRADHHHPASGGASGSRVGSLPPRVDGAALLHGHLQPSFRDTQDRSIHPNRQILTYDKSPLTTE